MHIQIGQREHDIIQQALNCFVSEGCPGQVGAPGDPACSEDEACEVGKALERQADFVELYHVKVSYIYREPDGQFNERGGQMLETSLTQDYLAKDPGEAIDLATAWADERLKNCMAEMYDKCSLGCIKVGTKVIGKPGETRNGFPFFEWKCDYTGTRDQWIRSAKDKLHLE